MERLLGLAQQARRHRLLLLLIYVPLAGILGGLVVAAQVTEIEMEVLTRDPAASLGAPVYLDALSLLGGLFWAGATAICLFAFLLLWRHPNGPEDPAAREDALFLLSAGLVTGVLMLDDVYMLHEAVFPFHLGIPEQMVYVGYAALMSAFLVRFHTTILRQDFLLLLLAFGALGTAVMADLAEGYVPLPGSYLLEDGLKLVGIVTWAAYFAQTSVQRVFAVETASVPEPARARSRQRASAAAERETTAELA